MLGVFRKRASSPEESIPEDLLEMVPEIPETTKPEPKAAKTPVAVRISANALVEEARAELDGRLDALAKALLDMEARTRSLEVENEGLVIRLREAEKKASVLDEIQASLGRLPRGSETAGLK